MVRGDWTKLTRAEFHNPVTHEEIVKWCRENPGKRIHYRAIRRFCAHGAASPNAVNRAIEEATA